MQLLHDFLIFWRQRNFYNFYETGDELYEIMKGFEKSMHVQTFFVMDENFLLHRKRAMELLERMKAAGKSWGYGGVCLRERDSQIYDEGIGGVGRVLDLDGPGIAALELCQAKGHGHAGIDKRDAQSTEYACKVRR